MLGQGSSYRANCHDPPDMTKPQNLAIFSLPLSHFVL